MTTTEPAGMVPIDPNGGGPGAQPGAGQEWENR